MDIYLVALAAILLASLLRLFIPYIQNKREDPDLTFDLRFVYGCIANIMVAFAASFQILAIWQPPSDVQSYILIFTNAFLFGWGQADLLFRLGTRTEKPRNKSSHNA